MKKWLFLFLSFQTSFAANSDGLDKVVDIWFKVKSGQSESSLEKNRYVIPGAIESDGSINFYFRAFGHFLKGTVSKSLRKSVKRREDSYLPINAGPLDLDLSLDARTGEIFFSDCTARRYDNFDPRSRVPRRSVPVVVAEAQEVIDAALEDLLLYDAAQSYSTYREYEIRWAHNVRQRVSEDIMSIDFVDSLLSQITELAALESAAESLDLIADVKRHISLARGPVSRIRKEELDDLGRAVFVVPTTSLKTGRSTVKIVLGDWQ